MTSANAVIEPAVRRARLAVVAAFVTNGLAFSVLLSRTPAVREDLGLDTATLGLLLLCISIGAVTGLPTSGPLVARFGPARTVLGGSLTTASGHALLTVGLATGTTAAAAVALVMVGLGMGVWDVAMNVEGTVVEQRLGYAIMPRLHAAFSIGTVTGAGVGALTAALAVPLAAQMAVVAVLAPALMIVATRSFLGQRPVATEHDAPSRFGVLDALREPRTILIGLMVLGFAFTEGSANDWIALALVDGYGAPAAIGAVAFAFFVAAMTVGRFFGTRLLDRFGRVVVLRATAVLALVGLLMVLFGGSVPVALAGALLWGIGASLGFPVGMSAAADDPAKAAARVSAVSTIGYTAFLAGPPLIGPLGQQVGILTALLAVVAALALGGLTSGAAKPLDVDSTPAPR